MVGARALRAGKAVIELSLLTGNVDKGLKKLESKLRDVGKGFRSLGSSGMKVSGAIGGLLLGTAKLAANFEKVRAEFTALTGSAAKAGKILGEIEKFALATPLASGDLQDATRTMLSFGVALDDVVPTLKRLGAIAGGDGEKLKRLSLAFGQVTGKGRLMAQEVNQMIESGFNPLQEISRTTGESMKSLMGRMEAGGISAKEVAGAFETATSQGGRFFGLLDKIAETAIGQWNNLSESVILVGRQIGEVLLPILKEVLASASKLVEQIAAFVKENKDLVMGLAKGTSGLFVFSAGIWAIGAALSGVSKVAKALLITLSFLYAHPVVAGLAAVAAAIGIIAMQCRTAETEGKKLSKVLDKIADNPQVKGGFLGRFAEALAAAASGDMTGLGRPKPAVNQFPSAPHVNQPSLGGGRSTAGASAILGGIRGGISGTGSAVDSAMRGIQAAIGGVAIPAMIAAGQAQGQAMVDRAAEAQRVEDEIARARIDAMKDETEAQKLAKQEAQIRLESAMRIREADKAGLLTPELRARLEELMRIQLDAAKANGGMADGISREGIFSTRFASQIFGGRDEQLAELRQIRRNTDPRNQQAGGGIAVA